MAKARTVERLEPFELFKPLEQFEQLIRLERLRNAGLWKEIGKSG